MTSDYLKRPLRSLPAVLAARRKPQRGIKTLEETVGERCPRCLEWQRLDLSSTCPACDGTGEQGEGK